MNKLIRQWSLGKPDKSLIIENQSLHYQGKSIDLLKVDTLLYSLEPIQFDMFYVGRKYKIVLAHEKEEIKIVFKTFFRIRNNYFHKLYCEIIDAIWTDTGARLCDQWLQRISDDELVEVGPIFLSLKGILYKGELYEWSGISFQENYNRIIVFSKTDTRFWISLLYSEVANTFILSNLLRFLIREKGFEKLNQNFSADSEPY